MVWQCYLIFAPVSKILVEWQCNTLDPFWNLQVLTRIAKTISKNIYTDINEEKQEKSEAKW